MPEPPDGRTPIGYWTPGTPVRPPPVDGRRRHRRAALAKLVAVQVLLLVVGGGLLLLLTAFGVSNGVANDNVGPALACCGLPAVLGVACVGTALYGLCRLPVDRYAAGGRPEDDAS